MNLSLLNVSVRARVTFAAMAAVALVLTVASFAILALVEGDLLRTAERAVLAELELEASDDDFDDDDDDERSFEFEDDDGVLALGDFVETSDGDLIGGLFEDGEMLVELVIDPESGELLQAYEPTTGDEIDDPEVQEVIEGLAFEALVIEAEDDSTQRQIFVGAAARTEVDESLEAVRGALMIMVPALVALLGALVWFLVGRALRPVGAMTERVAAISTSSLDQRVPVPAGNDEIANLAAVMNGMLGRLERGDERQREFAADASHELRSPLSAVRIAGELLGGSVADDRRRQLSQVVVDESDRMNVLIGDLLELSRIDETESTRSFGEVDLSVVAHAVCEDRDVALTASQAIVHADERQLTRALINMVDNAERHSAAHVAVSVGPSIAPGPPAVRIVVEDDGPGVPEHQRQVVFDRFARLDEARDRAGGGTGLGLALVRAIALRHGGDVRVDESPELGGARFTMTLPAAQGPQTL